jgi:alkylation response protein AidB-like acyl-CoA dehydrogenase
MTDRDAQMLAVAEAIGDLDHPLKAATSQWAAKHLAAGDRVAADHASAFSRDDWQRVADRGVLGVLVPEGWGGSDLPLAEALLTLEGLGHGCRDNGLAFAVGSQILSTQEALVRFGTDAQREQWLVPLVTGAALGAFSMTEPESGSDAYSLTTSAVEQADGSFVLNGQKAYITLGSRCDMVIVFARTNPDAGAWGLTAFVVPTDLDGVIREPNAEKMGMRTTPFGDITLHDVHLGADSVLGRVGAGSSIFNAVLLTERSFVFLTQVGAMQRQLETTIAYAKTREQGGQPIGRYQAVSHRIAEMKQQHETARLFAYRAAIARITGRDDTIAAALAKTVASEVGIDAATAALVVHGAKGYVTSFEVERDLRDAIGGLVYSGTSDIQRNIVARLLGVG